MKFLGNIIWLIFGGLHTAIEYFIAGLVLMITIIAIPFGLLRLEGEVEGVTARLSEHVHECAVVLCWRHLDLSHPHFLRSDTQYHHYRNPLGQDAFPLG